MERDAPAKSGLTGSAVPGGVLGMKRPRGPVPDARPVPGKHELDVAVVRGRCQYAFASPKEAQRDPICDGLRQVLQSMEIGVVWPRLLKSNVFEGGAVSPPHNFQPQYNVCHTDPIDTIVAQGGKRQLIRMRWGLVPR